MSKIIRNVLVGEYGKSLTRYENTFVGLDENGIEKYRSLLPQPILFPCDLNVRLFDEYKSPSNTDAPVFGYVVDVRLVKTSVNTVLLYMDFEPTELSNHLLNEGTKFSIATSGVIDRNNRGGSDFSHNVLSAITLDNARMNEDGKRVEWTHYHQFNKLFRED